MWSTERWRFSSSEIARNSCPGFCRESTVRFTCDCTTVAATLASMIVGDCEV